MKRKLTVRNLKLKIFLKTYEHNQVENLPFRLGCDWGRDACECDVILLRGRSSELCTDGLIEPGESVILVRSVFAALSRLCDFGLYCKLLKGRMKKNRYKKKKENNKLVKFSSEEDEK